MDSVELVRKICKEKKIPISKLERDLGYSNGYIGQLRKGVFPTNRLVEIAQYLSVSVDYLLGTETEKAPAQEGEREIINPDIRMIARAGQKMTPEQAENLRKYAQFMYPEAFNDNK
mgnify:CR=1 FL=1